jgi:hypothetical protein
MMLRESGGKGFFKKNVLDLMKEQEGGREEGLVGRRGRGSKQIDDIPRVCQGQRALSGCCYSCSCCCCGCYYLVLALRSTAAAVVLVVAADADAAAAAARGQRRQVEGRSAGGGRLG